MSDRARIGIIFSYNEGWIAGAYYIINLVNAIDRVSDNEKPELVIYVNSRNEFDKLKDETAYPYMEMRLIQPRGTVARLKRSINVRLKKYIGVNILQCVPETSDVVLVFPIKTAEQETFFTKAKRKVYWIPDFQEHFYPNFFPAEHVARRKAHQKYLSGTRSQIVFSSHTALKHYNELFPGNNSLNNVIRFAVQHMRINSDIDMLTKQYHLQQHWFICSNQFWQHKNHMCVLEAAKIVRDAGITFQILFTGAPTDARNPDFYNSLLNYTRQAQLEESVIFLGLIPRDHQLGLMKGARAVIQPSLFEGWSTVIEDAKSMSQFVFASDIEIHREQLQTYPNAALFDPASPESLAEMIQNALLEKPPIANYDYSKNVQAFSRDFCSLVSDATQ